MPLSGVGSLEAAFEDIPAAAAAVVVVVAVAAVETQCSGVQTRPFEEETLAAGGENLGTSKEGGFQAVAAPTAFGLCAYGDTTTDRCWRPRVRARPLALAAVRSVPLEEEVPLPGGERVEGAAAAAAAAAAAVVVVVVGL